MTRAAGRWLPLFGLIGLGILAGCTATVGASTAGNANKIAGQVRHSTFGIADVACGVHKEGSSFVIAPLTVVTNAHVVAGATNVTLQDNKVLLSASVVLYDPALDVAVLRVPGLAAPALTVYMRKVGKGASGVIVANRIGEPEVNSSGRITSTHQVVGLDIYGQKHVTRSIYQLHVSGTVAPGEGGAPFVSTGSSGGVPIGAVLGLLFARSTIEPATGYALAMGPVMAAVAKAEGSRKPMPTGACMSP